MSHQAPANDRAVGVPGIGHGDRFADMRARSKAFDEARVRSSKRRKKDRKLVQAADFSVGDVTQIEYRYPNGRVVPGAGEVVDVNPMLSRWREDGRVFVRWLPDGSEQAGHIFGMRLHDTGYTWIGTVRWVSG